MAGFSEEDIRRVRDANDLVELFSERTSVRQRGRDFWCCCPFHREKTPSCKIDPATQTWHCFGCGEGGDAITYVRKLDDVGFVDAVRFLARRAGIELQETEASRRQSSRKARVKDVCRETAEFYHGLLMRGKSEGLQAARDYLAKRGLGGAIPNEWNLGFAPGRGQLVAHLKAKGFTESEMLDANVAVRRQRLNDRFYDRVMFPINDVSGEPIAFGGRVIGQGEPKYLNSGDTPVFHKSDVLYALDKAKATMASTGTAIVCEGYTDVIALHQAGFTNTVATLGTALTRRHLRILSHHAKHRIVYVFDGDEAGQRAADRALAFIDASVTPEAGVSKVDLVAVTLPDNLDPADFLAQRGAEAFSACLDGAVPLIRFGIDRRLERHDLGTPEGRTRAGMEALEVLAPIKDSLLAKDYAVYIAGRVHAREEDMLERLSQLKPPAQPYDRDAAPGVRRETGSAADGAPGWSGGRSDGQTSLRPHGERVGTADGQGASPFGGRGVGSPAGQSAGLSGENPGHSGEHGPTVPIAPAQRNRLRSEREFLSVVAANPAMIASQAETLASVEWRSELHRQTAFALLDAAAQPGVATMADVLSFVSTTVPQAASLLTASTVGGSAPAADLLAFLGNELACGDLEMQIVQLRDELRTGSQLSPEEQSLYFQTTVALQQQLNALRSSQGFRNA